jgi:AraC-like DNA-binding protein
VLGPEAYALELNRASLGRIALTYVLCTSRIRVIPTEPISGFCLYMPLEGSIEIVVDGVQFAASPARPLLRGPAQRCLFEASPTRCLVVDIEAEAIAATSLAIHTSPPGHSVIDAKGAKVLRRVVKQLFATADRSRSLVTLQTSSAAQRGGNMPVSLTRLERSFLDAVVGCSKPCRRESASLCNVEALKEWLASQSRRQVTSSELASRAGVTPRTVQRAFLQTGCTPGEYVRSVRLARARTMLMAPPKDLTVAEAAIAVGFRHLGRFAEAYRRHFGESPSRTLARGYASREEHCDGVYRVTRHADAE